VKVRVCINCARKLFFEKLKAMKKKRKRLGSRAVADDFDGEPPNSHDEILEILFDFKSEAECKNDDDDEEEKEVEKGRDKGGDKDGDKKSNGGKKVLKGQGTIDTDKMMSFQDLLL
jgi:hypothetical protein